MRIYKVTLEHAFDFNTYYVLAPDVGTAAVKALRKDVNSEEAEIQGKSIPSPRVTSVTEFCAESQIVTSE